MLSGLAASGPSDSEGALPPRSETEWEAAARLHPDAGPHPVGVTARTLTDATRTWHDGDPGESEGRARPIQWVCWYPAAAGTADQGTPLPWSEYTALRAGELTGRSPLAKERQAHLDGWRRFSLREGADGERLDHWLAGPTRSFADAEPAGGRFPLLIYAPSFSANAFENASMCEYLASHGFVVSSCPSTGATTQDMTADGEGVAAQVADLRVMLEASLALDSVDPERIGVFGFSWGGLTGPMLAMSDPRIDAVVALDGSIGYEIGLQAVEGMEGFRPGRMAAAFLQTCSRGGATFDDGFMDSLRGVHTASADFEGLVHGDFGSENHLRFGACLEERDGEELARKAEDFTVLAGLTCSFFDWHLGGVDRGSEPFRPWEPSGAPARVHFEQRTPNRSPEGGGSSKKDDDRP